MGKSPHSYHAQYTRYSIQQQQQHYHYHYHHHRRQLYSSMSVPEAAHALLPYHTTTPSPEKAAHYICHTATRHDPVRACSSQSPPSVPRLPVPMQPPADRQHGPLQPIPASADRQLSSAQSQSQSPPAAHHSAMPPPQSSLTSAYAFHQNLTSHESHHRAPAQPPPRPQPMRPLAEQPLHRQQAYNPHQQHQHQHHIQHQQYQFRHSNAPPSPPAAASSGSYSQLPAQHAADRPTMAAAHSAREASQHPPPTHVSPSHLHHHRPYELQPTAPASRTFWNHYETGLLVQLWLEFEAQFLANKRNAGVWAQLAQRLTERSGRHRTVRECRIKWKNMWAKHRDLANASHMGLDAKLREFPHFSQFVAIRQRSSQSPHTLQNEDSEGKRTPSEDDRRASITTSIDPPLKWSSCLEPPAAAAGPAMHSYHHGSDQPAFSVAPPPKVYDERRSSLASILIADTHESQRYRSPGATYVTAASEAHYPPHTRRTPLSLAEAVSSMAVNATSNSRDSSESQDRTDPAPISEIPLLLRQADSSVGYYSAFDGEEYSQDSHATGAPQPIDGIIERMRVLAGSSTSADISAVAQQIMSYVERESRRRQLQSERHMHIVSALADVLSRSSTEATVAPSPSTSRRSSGPAHEHRRFYPAALDQKPAEPALHMIHEATVSATHNNDSNSSNNNNSNSNRAAKVDAATPDAGIPMQGPRTLLEPANVKLEQPRSVGTSPMMDTARPDSPL
ncbi:hypothetical protein EV175_001233 [Coemansia sp. RSA 1933]|nr:hypothetical protein EV175_001233 [Coemansia sp. RSA 1933]